MPHCNPVSVPIMMMRSGRPRVISATQPISLTISPAVTPLLALSLETRLSAGCDTTAQKTPAMYPAANETASCSCLEHSDLGLGTTYL